tara:strand:- start:29 stop:139 length:111 start_codon:yes stop_codon:yes gene_type:complete
MKYASHIAMTITQFASMITVNLDAANERESEHCQHG